MINIALLNFQHISIFTLESLDTFYDLSSILIVEKIDPNKILQPMAPTVLLVWVHSLKMLLGALGCENLFGFTFLWLIYWPGINSNFFWTCGKILILIGIANWRKCPIFPNVGHLLDDLNLSYDGHLVKGSWFWLLVNSVAECSIEILTLSPIRRIHLNFRIWFTNQRIMTVKFRLENSWKFLRQRCFV